MKDQLLAMDNVYVVHITGPKELDTVTEALSLTDEEKKRYWDIRTIWVKPLPLPTW